MVFWRILGSNFLAKQNNTFCRYLNRVMNSCFINDECYIPRSISLPHGQVVIGKAKIGENVTIFQNTTLGAKGMRDEELTSDSFPTIEDNVTIYANCMIIGGITIGKNSIIGAGTFIDKDIPPNKIVYNKRVLVMKENDRKIKIQNRIK